MNVKPRHLRMFVHLAQSLSFRETADHFGLTQPTLSRMLQDLEAECGVRLFERTTRVVRLTRAGHDLLGVAVRVVDSYEEGLSEIAKVVRQRQHRLSLAVLPTLASLLLPRALAALRDAHPEVIVYIRDVYTGAAIELLRKRSVDIALSSIDVDQDDLRYAAVTEEGFAFLASREHFSGLDSERWTDSSIDGAPLIGMWRGTGTRNCVDAAFKRKGLTFRPYVELQHLSVIKDFVRLGVGVTILPLSSARMIGDTEMFTIPMPDVPPRSVAIITRRDYRPDDLTRCFLEKVAEDLTSLDTQPSSDIKVFSSDKEVTQEAAESFFTHNAKRQ